MDKHMLMVKSKIKVQIGSMLIWEYKVGCTVVRRVFAGMVKVRPTVEVQQEVEIASILAMLAKNRNTEEEIDHAI